MNAPETASEALRRLLAKTLLSRPVAAFGSSDPALLTRLNAARQALAPPRGHRSLPRVAQGIMAFRIQQRHTPYPELKYACHGIARPTDWEGRLLIDDALLCDELLAAVSALRPRQRHAFAACCRGLQQALATDIAALNGRSAENVGKIVDFLSRHPTPTAKNANRETQRLVKKR